MKNLKRYLLLMLLCLPMALLAQVESKYLEGAVPVVDGKVTFSTTINSEGMSKAQIYETVLDWANKYFQPKEGLTPKVVYSNPEKGEIIASGEEYIVFVANYLVMDRTRIYYHLIANCEEGKCNLTMTRIHYWYEEDVDGGYKYKAEKWITDKEALNKAKNKLAKVSGKFRQKTIDYKDKLFNEIQTVLNGQTLASTNNPVAPSAPKAVTVEQPKTVKAEPKTAPVNQEEIINKAVCITLTADNDEGFEINKESWGGFGELFGKKVTFCLIDTQKTTGNMLMVNSDTYKVTFYSMDNKPVLTIHCRKLMNQTINGKEAQKMNKNCLAEKSYNMYVGEIIE